MDIDGQAWWVLLERLPWDSDFFARGMARLNAVVRDGTPPTLREDCLPAAHALEAVLVEARRRGIDYVLAPAAPCAGRLRACPVMQGAPLAGTPPAAR